MGFMDRYRQISARQFRRLRNKPVFAFTEAERVEEQANEELFVDLIISEEPQPQSTEFGSQAAQSVPQSTEPDSEVERDPPEQEHSSQSPAATASSARTDLHSASPHVFPDKQLLQVLEQLQEDVKLLRREQEYLLNVTESSQAFLETLSRELISVLQILGKNEENLTS